MHLNIFYTHTEVDIFVLNISICSHVTYLV